MELLGLIISIMPEGVVGEPVDDGDNICPFSPVAHTHTHTTNREEPFLVSNLLRYYTPISSIFVYYFLFFQLPMGGAILPRRSKRRTTIPPFLINSMASACVIFLVLMPLISIN